MFPVPHFCITSPVGRAQCGRFRSPHISALRGCLATARISGTCSGHSFRRGVVTPALTAGVANHDIQLLGRWRSDANKRYIKAHPEHIYDVSRRFQAAQSAQSQHPPSILPLAPLLLDHRWALLPRASRLPFRGRVGARTSWAGPTPGDPGSGNSWWE